MSKLDEILEGIYNDDSWDRNKTKLAILEVVRGCVPRIKVCPIHTEDSLDYCSECEVAVNYNIAIDDINSKIGGL